MTETNSKKNKYLEIIQKAYHHKVFRYILSGGFSASVDISIFILSYNYLFNKHDVNFGSMVINGYIAALCISYTCGSLTSFLINKLFVFSTKTSWLSQIIKSLPVYILAFAGNYLLLKFFVEFAHFWPTISRALAAIIVAFITFNLHKYFTFKQNNSASENSI